MENNTILKREDEITDISKMSSLPTESKPQTLIEKAKETISHLTHKNKEEITEKAAEIKQEATEKVEETKPEEASKGILGSLIQSMSHMISQSVETITGKFKTEKEVPEGQEGQSLKEKIQEKVDEVKDKIQNKDGTQGFIEVKEGISEDVEELRKEEKEELQKELHSDNPFEALADSNTEIKESDAEGKTMGEKIKDASNTISEKLTETKEKIKSKFVSTDKENAPQATA